MPASTLPARRTKVDDLADCSIVALGRNQYGQCDVPPSNEDFMAVTAGYWHSLRIKNYPIQPDQLYITGPIPNQVHVEAEGAITAC